MIWHGPSHRLDADCFSTTPPAVAVARTWSLFPGKESVIISAHLLNALVSEWISFLKIRIDDVKSFFCGRCRQKRFSILCSGRIKFRGRSNWKKVETSTSARHLRPCLCISGVKESKYAWIESDLEQSCWQWWCNVSDNKNTKLTEPWSNFRQHA